MKIVNVFRSFAFAQNDTEDGENINENVCRRIAKLMLINLFFLLKSWTDKLFLLHTQEA